MGRKITIGLICIGTAGSLLADFSYEENSHITGGAIVGMMKFAGAFSKSARDITKPTISSVSVKGNRMVRTSDRTMNIIDLDAETITDVDFEKKTYSVITFEQMKQAMQRAADQANRKMAEEKPQPPAANNSNVDVNWKLDIKETGEKKNINGLDTKEVVMTITMEGTDQKTGQSGAMDTVSDMWLTPKVPGYDEINDFHIRMAKKLAWVPSSLPVFRPDMMKGMSALATEGSKLKGVPVMQVVRMGPHGAKLTGPPSDPSTSQGPTAGQVAGRAAGDQAESSATSRLGRLGGFGGLGGLGGFGGKKKKTSDDPPPPSQDPAAANGGALMEMTVELTNYSSASVDPSKFEVPGGFKKIESPIERAPR
jgi:hypothetical protein